MTTIPDRQTILWRRHLCVSVIRVGAAGLIVWAALGQSRDVLSAVAFNPITGLGQNIALAMLNQLPLIAIAAFVLIFQRRIARWIIPDGFRVDVCPACGYSLKNLKSPICPECGSDVRPAAAPVPPAPAYPRSPAPPPPPAPRR